MSSNEFPQGPLAEIALLPEKTPGWTYAEGLTQESAELASKLLTKNHALYHTRWNAGFHNHIVHHLLAMWGLNASPAEIQEMWDYNVPYQAPIDRDHASVPTNLDLSDPRQFNACLGKDMHYIDFLEFFRSEIAEKGVPATFREYVLKGDARANDIHARMYTDLVHPMIHVGCALEYQQPSLVAEALAAACVHDNWPIKFLQAAEDYAATNAAESSLPLLDMITEMSKDPVIATGVRDDDPFNKIADGLMKRVTGADFAPHLGRYRVAAEPAAIRTALAEMMHTGAYIMAAAQRPGKHVMFDFVLAHNVTLSGYYPAIIGQPWLTDAERARLLEAKARVDAVMYASCACPTLYPERIKSYQPRDAAAGWQGLFHRANTYHDEGHAPKLTRALYALEQHFPDETGAELPIDKKDFATIAHMGMDSLERAFEPGGTLINKETADAVLKMVGHGGEMVLNNKTRWVFYGGLPSAWNFVPAVH